MKRRVENASRLIGCISRFQEADYVLRTFAVVGELGFVKDSIFDSVFDALEDLEQFLANAKEGQFLQLQSSRLTASEQMPFFRYGTRVLNVLQQVDQNVFTEWEQIFIAGGTSEKTQLFIPDQEYQAFVIMYLSLCYLARLKTINYKQLTGRNDVKVSKRMEEIKTFWQMNLTPEYVLGKLRKIHSTILNVSVAPQLILNNHEALELCHFIALVSKVGRLSLTAGETKK